MPARSWPACVLVLGVAAVLPAADPPAAPQPAPVPRPAAKPDPLAELIAKLHTRIDDPIQPNDAVAGEYIAALAKKHGLRIVIDTEGFKNGGVPNPEEVKVSFPAPKGVRLRTILQSLSDAVSGRTDGDLEHGVVLVYDTHVVISHRAQLPVIFRATEGLPTDRDRSMIPLLNVVSADRPLAEILRETAEVYDVNVVIAPQAAKPAEAAVRVRLLNAPLDTGLTTLAGLAGLVVHRTDNVFLVTTSEHAKSLREQSPPPRPDYLVLWPGGVGCGVFPYLLPTAGLGAPRFLSDPVSVELTKAPLDRTLKGWAGGGVTIVIDPAVGKKAEAEVTARLNGVSCEAAVKILAELAELRAVRLDNAMFVTTPEKAAQLAPPAATPTRKKDKKGR